MSASTRVARTFGALCTILLAATAARADVVRVEVTARHDILAGRAFGAAGAYEWIAAKAYFALDPANPRNQIVVDLALAPKNAAGLVEFSADLVIVRPKDQSRASGVAVFDVVNRGRPQIFSFLSRGSGRAAPDVDAYFGDGFLMKQGATIVWLGWQQDAADAPGLLRMVGPRIPGIQGMVDGEIVVPARVNELELGDRGAIPYEVADPHAATNTLMVSAARGQAAQPVARDQWAFARMRNGTLVDDTTHIYLKNGFEPGAVYQVSYGSREPRVAGLGLAGVRDIMSWMRYDPTALVRATHAYGFGISQSGRFLRQFVHDGFNADSSGRQVFDGLMIHIAGGSSRGFNARFAQPSLSPSSRVFPFTDLEQTDSVTGERDGLLTRVTAARVVPKILYTSSSWEYWGAAAANIHTQLDGRADMKIPATSRVYLMAGTQHVPVAFPPEFDRVDRGQLRENPMDYRPVLRALFVALDQWVRSDTAPPDSSVPTIKEGTLISTARLNVRGLQKLNVPPGPKLFSRPSGSKADSKAAGKPYLSLVSQIDDDGNETAGVRAPAQAVPLATYTGWNLRDPSIGAPTDLIQSTGSYAPFPRTRAERERSGESRRSIEERYPSMQNYLTRIGDAARALVGRRLLLADDVDYVVKAAEVHWKAATASAPTATAQR